MEHGNKINAFLQERLVVTRRMLIGSIFTITKLLLLQKMLMLTFNILSFNYREKAIFKMVGISFSILNLFFLYGNCEKHSVSVVCIKHTFEIHWGHSKCHFNLITWRTLTDWLLLFAIINYSNSFSILLLNHKWQFNCLETKSYANT